MVKKSVIGGIIAALLICVTQSALFAGDGWLTSFDKGKEIAKKEKKDIIVDFTGSDWCGWCIQLHEEVFSTDKWKKEGSKKYVMVSLDFPRNKQMPEDEKKANDKLMKLFGVEGFPTIFLVDSDGKPYAKTGYQKGGPENYLKHLGELSKQKETRDNIMSEIKKAEKEESLKLLDELIGKLKEWGVDGAYVETKEEIVGLDSDNKNGMKLKYSVELTYYYRKAGEPDKSNAYLNEVEKLSEGEASSIKMDFKIEEIEAKYLQGQKPDFEGAKKALNELIKDNKKGKIAQKVYFEIAGIDYQLKNNEACIKDLENALNAAPDSELASQIKGILKEKFNK
ncbi:MAG: thioredoxin family protein [Planctomycetes bacterium]|nr:thioredoxin family protein [Planctomycetota bacterium]